MSGYFGFNRIIKNRIGNELPSSYDHKLLLVQCNELVCFLIWYNYHFFIWSGCYVWTEASWLWIKPYLCSKYWKFLLYLSLRSHMWDFFNNLFKMDWRWNQCYIYNIFIILNLPPCNLLFVEEGYQGLPKSNNDIALRKGSSHGPICPFSHI